MSAAPESKTALVTGGSRGIGRATVEALLRSGRQVAFTYAGSQSAAQEIVRQATERGQRCQAFQADVRDFERARAVVQEASAQLGTISLLVNNAGIKRDGALFSMKIEDWRDVLDTNLSGTFHYCRALIGGMMKRRAGVIVNMVSVSGIAGMPGQTNYSASKAGVIGFSKALAKETARFGVRVHALAPGLIETDMTQDMPAKARESLLARVPAGRLGRPEEVARMVVWLAEEAPDYLTGQVIPLDGGLT